MIIERTLEKMKHEAQAKLRAAPPAATPEARHRPPPAVAPGAPAPARPQFPVVEPSEKALEDSRVMLNRSAAEEGPRPDAAYRILRARLLQAMRTNSWTTLAV